MNKSPVIALLTDFGTADSYVASMKGVILGMAPQATIIDITHEIKPQDINSAAYVLWSAYKFFPKKTIFVCVIDPGVGSERNILCVQTKDDVFLAPDNGVLKFILDAEVVKKTVVVSNPEYFRDTVSRTFHGRDIFAPVAAHLANGLPAAKLGPALTRIPPGESFVTMDTKEKIFHGKVIHIDRFGNLITNFIPGSTPLRTIQLRINRHIVNNCSETYSGAPAKKTFMITGSNGLLEISVKNGNASRVLNAEMNRNISAKVIEDGIAG